jgi:allene oxide cyclase-like protein
MNGKRWMLVAAAGAVLAMTMGSLALAQTRGRPARAAGTLHVVLGGTPAHVHFFDFERNGLGLGDRLAARGPILNEDQSARVGTSYLDCWIGSGMVEDGSPYVCTYLLTFADGSITVQGIDPHGVSDVYLAVLGGTGAYVGLTGEAHFIDTDVTDVYIDLG